MLSRLVFPSHAVLYKITPTYNTPSILINLFSCPLLEFHSVYPCLANKNILTAAPGFHFTNSQLFDNLFHIVLIATEKRERRSCDVNTVSFLFAQG